MKPGIRLFAITFLSCLFFTVSAQESTEKKKRESNFSFTSRNLNHFGYEVAQPQLRSGANSVGLWQGIYADIAGIVSIGYLRGMVSYKDGNTTLYTPGSYYYVGSQVCYSLIRNNNIDIYPFWGIGLQMNKVQNAKKYLEQDEDRQFDALGIGAYGSAGVGAVIGPVHVKAKAQALASFNLNKANEFRALQWFPSFTVGLKLGKALLNPYLFTVDGIDYRTDVSNEKITREHIYGTKYDQVTYSYDVTTTLTEGSASVFDVRPYFFMAPYYSGKLDPAIEVTPRNFGLQAGFRYGSLYIDANYHRGNFAFNDPVKRDGFDEPTNSDYGIPRMDGVFSNSTRYGGRIGADLVTWFVKSNFIPYSSSDRKRLKQATSFVALIPTFGMGRVNLGKFEFSDPAGEAAYQQYAIDHQLEPIQQLPMKVPMKSTKYLSGGIQLIVGTVALEYDMFFYDTGDKYKKTNSTLGISWKLPVIRMLRIGKAIKLDNQKPENQ